MTLCTECGGFGTNVNDYVRTGDFTYKHVSCVNDYPESTIEQDANELFFCFIAGLRYAQDVIREEETEFANALRKATHDFCGGYGQNGYDKNELNIIISYIKNGAGMLGYRIGVDDEFGVSFFSERKHRKLIFIRPADAIQRMDVGDLFGELLDSLGIFGEDTERVVSSQLGLCERVCPCNSVWYCKWATIADMLIHYYRNCGEAIQNLLKDGYDGVWIACFDHDEFTRVKILSIYEDKTEASP